MVSSRDRICLACREKSCCYHFTVILTARDILRIARTMQLAPADFVTPYAVPEGGSGSFILRPEGPPLVLALAKRHFPDQGTSPCGFLVKTNDHLALCGLGDLRPGQCRAFPAYLSGNFIAIANDTRGCVRTWSYGDLDLDGEWRRLEHVRSEEAEHHVLAEEWNRRVRENGREYSLDEFCAYIINRTVMLEKDESGACGPCGACRKRCCTSYTVSITGFDAWMIGKWLHLPLESFLIHFLVSEKNERGFMLEQGGKRYEIALDKVGEYQKGNPCIFWIELESGNGRCGIYQQRPMVCQTYPAYQQQEMVILRDDVLCPEGAWNLAGMDLGTFRQRLSRFRMEQDIYAYIVGGWNRMVEQDNKALNVGEYYTALMNVYEQINRWRENLPLTTVDRLVRTWGDMQPGMPNPLFADMAPSGNDGEWHDMIVSLRECINRSVPWFNGLEEPFSEAA